MHLHPFIIRVQNTSHMFDFTKPMVQTLWGTISMNLQKHHPAEELVMAAVERYPSAFAPRFPWVQRR